MSLEGVRLPARWCPAWRRREPGLLLLRGTWEGVPRYGCPGAGGERERPGRRKPWGTEYRRGVRWRT